MCEIAYIAPLYLLHKENDEEKWISNIGEESYMDAYGSVYYYSEKYNGITNYQVTAKYMGTTNSCN